MHPGVSVSDFGPLAQLVVSTGGEPPSDTCLGQEIGNAEGLKTTVHGDYADDEYGLCPAGGQARPQTTAMTPTTAKL